MRLALKRDLLPLGILLLLPIIFCWRLFWPQIQVFYPPDFLMSDLIHVNFAQKAALAEALHQHQLPLLSNLLANGFPLLAESQIGALSPINWLLYYFFTLPVAFNLTYLLGFIVMNVGSYYLTIKLTKNRSLAVFAAVSWMFSGIVMQKIVHQGVLQAMFFIPWAWAFHLQLLITKRWRYAALLALVLSQQFLFGHLFIALATALLVGLSTVIYLSQQTNRWTIFWRYLFAAVLFLLIIAPQLIQTLIYASMSNRANATGGNLFILTFEWPYFATLLTPFPFGSFTNGDFFRGGLWGNTQTIPWETSLFVGYALLPVTIILIKQHKRIISQLRLQPLIWVTVTGLIVSFILMFGYQTPLKFIYSLPVINAFRAVARYSVFTSFFLIILLTILLGYAKVNQKLIWLLILIQLIGGWWHFGNYIPVLPVKKILTKPPFNANLKQHSTYEYGSTEAWFSRFRQQGYSQVTDYLNYHNAHYPYLNLLYQTKSCGFFKYSHFGPEPYYEYVSLLDRELGQIKQQQREQLSPLALNLLRLLGCDQLMLTFPVKNARLVREKAPFYLYALSNPVPRFGLYSKTEDYLTTSLFQESLGTFDFNTLYLPNSQSNNTLSRGQIKLLSDSALIKRYRVKSKTTSYLLQRQLNYPGWKAYSNQQPLTIYPADTVYQAVKLPRGEHLVEFRYQAPYWHISLVLSGMGYLISCLFLIWPLDHSNRDSGHDL